MAGGNFLCTNLTVSPQGEPCSSNPRALGMRPQGPCEAPQVRGCRAPPAPSRHTHAHHSGRKGLPWTKPRGHQAGGAFSAYLPSPDGASLSRAGRCRVGPGAQRPPGRQEPPSVQRLRPCAQELPRPCSFRPTLVSTAPSQLSLESTLLPRMVLKGNPIQFLSTLELPRGPEHLWREAGLLCWCPGPAPPTAPQRCSTRSTAGPKAEAPKA